MSERCERTELLVDDCAHCRGHKSIEEQVAEEKTAPDGRGWFPAQYPGSCSSCGEHFDEGDLIHRVLGIDGWVAGCCATDVAR